MGNGFRLDTDFRKLWVGQAISQIGSNITGVGLPLTAVLVLKASPLQMGFLSGVGAAAVLIFGLFAGAWVDRLRRRPILIAADLGRAVVLGIVLAIIWMSAAVKKVERERDVNGPLPSGAPAR